MNFNPEQALSFSRYLSEKSFSLFPFGNISRQKKNCICTRYGHF